MNTMIHTKKPKIHRNKPSHQISVLVFLVIIESYKLEVEHILPKTWQNTNFDEWNDTSHSQYLEQISPTKENKGPSRMISV